MDEDDFIEKDPNPIATGCLSIILFYGALFLVLLLSACTTTRHTQTHATCIDRAHIVHRSCTETQSFEDIYRQWSQSQWSDLYMHMRIYDTGKPPDSTGHHPLLADIELSRADSTETLCIDTTKIQASEIDTEAEDSSNLSFDQRDTETDTRAGTDSWQIYAIISIIIACLAIFAWGQGWITIRHRT